jgi:hypothetical protein
MKKLLLLTLLVSCAGLKGFEPGSAVCVSYNYGELNNAGKQSFEKLYVKLSELSPSEITKMNNLPAEEKQKLALMTLITEELSTAMDWSDMAVLKNTLGVRYVTSSGDMATVVVTDGTTMDIPLKDLYIAKIQLKTFKIQ